MGVESARGSLNDVVYGDTGEKVYTTPSLCLECKMVTQLSQSSVGNMETTAPNIVRGECIEDLTDEFNELFSSLANEQRRFIMYQLLNQTGTTTSEDLAEAVADSPKIESSSYDAVKTTIQHRHLPELEKAGYVDIDADSGLVNVTIDSKQARYLIDYVAEESGWK